MSERDTVNVTTLVAVEPARAFAVFTEQIGQWWRPQPRFHFMVGRAGTLRFEPGPDGRLVECYDVGPPYEVGRVLVWDPPERLAFEFR
nr:ATPase [Actinomycetota bacterium]NIT93964.1 ATPase [Actinomycetota bacterium]NIU17600.1 ATPase [Actinomycetota bacterium]NIU63948.1 ATPase [Actinomycetota bacterium]NIW25745.1 ATPase [Actinomycetota bacterium]